MIKGQPAMITSIHHYIEAGTAGGISRRQKQGRFSPLRPGSQREGSLPPSASSTHTVAAACFVGNATAGPTAMDIEAEEGLLDLMPTPARRLAAQRRAGGQLGESEEELAASMWAMQLG